MPETENKPKIIQGASTERNHLPVTTVITASPYQARASRAESIRLRTLPVGVRGKSGTSSKYFGTL
jgi:hypothetical protein